MKKRSSWSRCIPVGAGAIAMLAPYVLYVAQGSPGDQPELASFSVATSSAAYGPLNQSVLALEALEPGPITGEAPGHDFNARFARGISPGKFELF
jgi:hypothetical protein